ncbi:MAG: ABC transporter permease [Nocardioides sp.]|uniref:ABC transporter permease n=1 Tax=Nocardioides sp. TaxID=35761 RepID=UPI0039E3EAA8
MSSARKPSPPDVVLSIARSNLKRLFAERANLFFVVVLPLLIVFSLGIAIRGDAGDYRVGVVDQHPTAASRAITARMSANANVTVVKVADAQTLRDDVARHTLDVGWVVESVPDSTTYRWYDPGTGNGTQLRTVFTSVVEEAGVRETVTHVVARDADVSDQKAAAAVESAAQGAPPIKVSVDQVGDSGDTVAGIRAVLAAGQLSLFIFLTSLTGATALLTTRQLGVTRRMRAAPVRVSTIVGGEALGRFAVAMVQAAIVFFGSILLFGVNWVAPGAVALLCVAMSVVGTGAAMLLGTLGRSEQQVGAIGLLLSLVLGALGGSMQPLEFFPDTLRTVAFVTTPHAWMNDALWRILVEGEGLGQVWPAILVLTAVGAALLGLASWAMARTLR